MHDEDYGLCQCGCGQKTEPYGYSDKRTGVVKGQPRRYLENHQHRRSGPEYEERDLGYETPCWIWLGAANKGGYARFDTKRYAHRVYYERAKGLIPEGLPLDHLCHNADKSCPGGPCLHRRCLNPNHLEPKPGAANSRAGRMPKLTIENVRDIRGRPKTYGSTLALAREFNVHPVWISVIRNHPDRVWLDTPDT